MSPIPPGALVHKEIRVTKESTPQPAPDGLVRLVVYVPQSVKRAVKVAAAMDDTDASAWARKAIEQRLAVKFEREMNGS